MNELIYIEVVESDERKKIEENFLYYMKATKKE